MDDISRKFRAVDWGNVKRQVRSMQKATASSLKDMVMTDLENKVRAATNESPWAASGSDLMEIAQASFSREDYALITSILWQRLGSTRWRCVYKGLEMLRHLLMHGSSRILDESRAAVTHIEALEHYRSIDPVTRKDDGINVRRRAKAATSAAAAAATPAVVFCCRRRRPVRRPSARGARRALGGPSASGSPPQRWHPSARRRRWLGRRWSIAQRPD